MGVLASGDWVWRPAFPMSQIAALTWLLVVAACFAYCRSFAKHRWSAAPLLLMRLVASLGCAILLAGPSRMPLTSTIPRPMDLTVLLDTSESMLTQDCRGRSRFLHARDTWFDQEFLTRLSRDCNLRFQGFSEQLMPLSPNDLFLRGESMVQGRETRLVDSLNASLSRAGAPANTAALLLLSDGHDTNHQAVQSAAALAKSSRIPVFAVPFGGQVLQRDLALLAIPRQEYLLPDEPGAILVKAYQFGLPGAQSAIRLRQGDTVRRVPIEFGDRSVVEMQLEILHDQEGQFEYQISLDAAQGESELSNNEQTLFVEVQRRRLRVLVVEGQPYWDTKFLAQSLRKDERIELTQITQVSDRQRETIVARVEGKSPKLPSSQEEWSRYDVVIVGRDLERMIDPPVAEALKRFVLDSGGHLVFARGRPYDPTNRKGALLARVFEPLEPLTWSDELVREPGLELTAAGKTAIWLSSDKLQLEVADVFHQLPGLEAMMSASEVKPAAIVLAKTQPVRQSAVVEGQPVLLTMQAGSGQVAALNGQGSWRWSLLAPESDSLAEFYDAFWSSLVRWLVIGGDFRPGDQVSMRVSRGSVRLGESVDVELVFKRSDVASGAWSIDWAMPDGQVQQLQLGSLPGRTPRFRSSLEPSQVGVHTLTLKMPDPDLEPQLRKFTVCDLNVERLDTAARPNDLQMLAEHSGGRLLDAERPGDLLEWVRMAQLAREVPPSPQYVWDRWAVMVLLLSWCGAEWILRRLAGML